MCLWAAAPIVACPYTGLPTSACQIKRPTASSESVNTLQEHDHSTKDPTTQTRQPNDPWESKTFIFRGYNPYIGGLKPSFFMVLGSKGWIHLRDMLQIPNWCNTGPSAISWGFQKNISPTCTPKKTNECPLQRGHFKRKIVFHPLFFQGTF